MIKHVSIFAWIGWTSKSTWRLVIIHLRVFFHSFPLLLLFTNYLLEFLQKFYQYRLKLYLFRYIFVNVLWLHLQILQSHAINVLLEPVNESSTMSPGLLLFTIALSNVIKTLSNVLKIVKILLTPTRRLL